jgi:hypothetical protein
VGGAPDASGDESLDVRWFPPGALPDMPQRILDRIGHAHEDRPGPFYVT